MEFEDLLKRVRGGSSISSSELLPYLCLENREERCRINFRLAEAYSEISDFEQAKVFVVRSWVLSRFSPDVLPLYIKIHSALDDINSIREAYKRIGMIESSNGKIAETLRYFNLWHYAFANHQRIDKYEYDFDILERIEEMAEPWRFKRYAPREFSGLRKIRLGYLTFGMSHSNSVLIKINRMFARYHDKSRFAVTFFVPEECRSEQARENIQLFKNYGCDVVIKRGHKNELEDLVAVGRQIYDNETDVLITSALLGQFEHYFITCLHPAPIIVGLVQGPPPQFVAPWLDWSISWSKHPLIDSPCNCSLVKIGLDLPDVHSVKPYTKKDLGIPEDNHILLSAGRHVKFQDVDFWKVVLGILCSFPRACYVVVGVSKEQIPFLDELFPAGLTERIKLLGWREDALRVFCLADVIIDTFPTGGGHVLFEAMALGIPFVSFENNYMKKFDPTDWSVADEFVSIPELIVNRGDMEQFKCVVKKLIEDEVYRGKMGKLCKDQIISSMGSPEKGVKHFESTLLKIIERKTDDKKNYFGADEISKHSNDLFVRFRKLFQKSR